MTHGVNFFIGFFVVTWFVHPLRLSLCEIKYDSQSSQLRVNLKLFLTDIDDAILLDQGAAGLEFCQPNEHEQAEQALITYLNKYFHVKVNGTLLNLKLNSKKLGGTGINTALWCHFVFDDIPPIADLEIKDAVFTEMFFDQSNLVYIHIDDENRSLMLNKKQPVHTVKF